VVDGSSPSEGFKKPLQIRLFHSALVAGFGDKVAPGRTRRKMIA
jgi:hypothetical protein